MSGIGDSKKAALITKKFGLALRHISAVTLRSKVNSSWSIICKMTTMVNVSLNWTKGVTEFSS
jgi:hypothetical protein